MATVVNLTMREDNDETVLVTLTPATPDDDLTDVTGLEFVMKASTCEDDDDDDAVILTIGDGITITTQSATQIAAEVAVPAAALADPYERAWRLDALTGSARRTAMYGTVTVIDL